MLWEPPLQLAVVPAGTWLKLPQSKTCYLNRHRVSKASASPILQAELGLIRSPSRFRSTPWFGSQYLGIQRSIIEPVSSLLRARTPSWFRGAFMVSCTSRIDKSPTSLWTSRSRARHCHWLLDAGAIITWCGLYCTGDRNDDYEHWARTVSNELSPTVRSDVIKAARGSQSWEAWDTSSRRSCSQALSILQESTRE